MLAAAFVVGAGLVTAALSHLQEKQTQKKAERKAAAEKEFDELASRAVSVAPYVASTTSTVEHVSVPHLKDYFDDLPSFDRSVLRKAAKLSTVPRSSVYADVWSVHNLFAAL